MTGQHYPLLQMRLLVPSPSSHTLPRPALLAALADSEARLVLLSAPAGFGKTTLLTSWCHELEAAGVAVAWLTLEASDDDLPRFLTYLRAALAAAIGAWPEGDDAGVEPALTALLNALAAHGGPVVLVFDDLHRVQSPAVHAAIAFLLEHLPPQARLALASRSDPPLHLAMLRARGQLVELRAAELRFSKTELEAFFHAASLPLSAEELAAIDRTIEGWPAGCRLVALAERSGDSLALSTGPGEAPHLLPACIAGSQAHLFALLGEEVFAGLPAHLKAFLLQTAILEQLSGPLCDAVLGLTPATPTADTYSQRILDELEHANLFVHAIDGERRWFRVHWLFRAFLQEQLAHEPPELVAALHRRASAWFDSAGQVVPAVEHALAGDDGDRAAELIERAAVPLVARGEHDAAEVALHRARLLAARLDTHAVAQQHQQSVQLASGMPPRAAPNDAPIRPPVLALAQRRQAAEKARERVVSQPYAAAELEPMVEPLSAREREVLALVARGASNQEIAERLVVSLGTVKCHLNHILGKLGARSRTEAVARARTGGLLP